MNSTPVRIAGFVVGLAALFAVALGVGRLVGPIDQPEPAAHATDGHGDDQERRRARRSRRRYDGHLATGRPGRLRERLHAPAR